MRFSTLEEWLLWQERLNPREIDLGLERTAAIWRQLAGGSEPGIVITVAGTNGKGSTVAMLEAILGSAGYRTGSYTSPHLIRYNERIRLDGKPVADDRIVRAFDLIDRLRKDRPLTYFEFGTLAALWIMLREQVDVLLLEVGLGGRLDAVNVVDADLAIITSIDLDHQEWLGDDREAIGREKAGIFRPGRPAVFSAPDMPASVAEEAERLGTPLFRNGTDFRVRPRRDHWDWEGPSRTLRALPRPSLPGRHQLDNAAGAIMGLELLRERLPLDDIHLRNGLRAVELAGRHQQLRLDGVTWILDVAHNPRAVEALRDQLAQTQVPGRTLALLGMLADKDAGAVIGLLDGLVDQWHYASLEGPRGRASKSLGRLRPGIMHHSVREAVEALREAAEPGDRILVLGSFHTVGQALEALPD